MITPWYIKLPKDHALILRSLDFNFGDKFYPFSGLVYDASPRINIPMLLNLEKKPIMIRAGDPLVLLEIVNVKNVPKLEMVHQSPWRISARRYALGNKSTSVPWFRIPSNPASPRGHHQEGGGTASSLVDHQE